MDENWVLEVNISVKNLPFATLEMLEEYIANIVKDFCPEPGEFSIGGGIVPEEMHEELELANDAFIDMFADRDIHEPQELASV